MLPRFKSSPLKKNLLLFVTTFATLSFTQQISAQAPDLGTAAAFVLFSSNGAVSNSGSSHVTGNVGTNNGSSTAFGNVNGVMHDNDGASAQCSADLLGAYNQLNALVPTAFPSALLGNGITLNAGIYEIAGNTSLNLELILDGQNNPGAVFVFGIGGAFSANAASKITLINGAKACNVFWRIEGLVSLASGSTMRGTIIANNSAIAMSSGVTLEGRALSTTGAVTLDGILAYLPTGCNSPYLTGPLTPELGSAACYALFSTNGSVSNIGTSIIIGDVGSNNGAVTGYSALNVTGTIHTLPDASTALAAADLLNAYNYVNTLPYDIELLYPAQFGNGLVLTPHTYLLNAATTFTDTVFLNAEGNANAIFVLQINGALNAAAYSKVALINGAQAMNVYWKVEGAVTTADYCEFAGTIISNNGPISGLNTATQLNGRALVTNGALTTAAITADMGIACSIADLDETKNDQTAAFFPNPFESSFTVSFSAPFTGKAANLRVFALTGTEVLNIGLYEQTTVVSNILPSGIYFYRVTGFDGQVMPGKLISGL